MNTDPQRHNRRREQARRVRPALRPSPFWEHPSTCCMERSRRGCHKLGARPDGREEDDSRFCLWMSLTGGECGRPWSFRRTRASPRVNSPFRQPWTAVLEHTGSDSFEVKVPGGSRISIGRWIDCLLRSGRLRAVDTGTTSTRQPRTRSRESLFHAQKRDTRQRAIRRVSFRSGKTRAVESRSGISLAAP